MLARLRSRLLGLVVALLVVAWPGRAAAGDVILISIDGLMPVCYTKADELGLKIPNLRRVMKEGVHAKGAITVTPSVTFPAHTTIISGVLPARHGVYNNEIFDPDDKLGGGWHWYYRDLEAPTLFDALRDAKKVTASVTWPVTAGGPIDHNLPDMYSVPNLREAKNLVALASEEGLDDVLPPAEELIHLHDDVRTDVALEFLGRKPEFMAVHYLGLDGAQHRNGPLTPKAFEALEKIDAEIGRLFKRLDDEGRWQDTTVIVVSDHGFLPVHTMVQPGVLMRALGLVELDDDGDVTRWDAMPWAAGGNVALYVHPDAPETTAKRLDQVLQLLKKGKDYGVRQVWRGKQIDKRGGFPGAYAVLDAQPGYYFSGSVRGEQVTVPAGGKGTHGYDPKRLMLRAAFLAKGPEIRVGKRIGTVRLLDVAPTIAKILGVKLDDVQGKVIRAALR
jgi:arylsulfatase A-like enzyme